MLSTKHIVSKESTSKNESKPISKQKRIKTIAHPLVISLYGTSLKNDPKNIKLTDIENDLYQQKYGSECPNEERAIFFKNYLNDLEQKLIAHPNVGGVILFTRNYISKKQLLELTTHIKLIAKKANKKDFFICADQEGGNVQRFKDEFTIIPSAKTFYKMYDENSDKALLEAKKYGYIMAKELKDCGVDLSLAPVCDLDLGNKVISGLDRAYHSSPQKAIEIISAFIDGMNDAKMKATAKHFPGHGMKGIGDSHKVKPIDKRPFSVLEKNDLLVFKTLIEQGKIQALMPAHVMYSDIDSEYTAGTSKIWLHDILKEKLNYKGVIISDCLSMEGAFGKTHLEKVLNSLHFGDIGLFCNQPPWVFLDVADQLSEHIIKEKSPSLKIAQWLSPKPKTTSICKNKIK